MKVRFWGVRGSFATPGSAYLRYGGNTSAVEVTADSGARIVCDLGTGVTELAKHLKHRVQPLNRPADCWRNARRKPDADLVGPAV